MCWCRTGLDIKCRRGLYLVEQVRSEVRSFGLSVPGKAAIKPQRIYLQNEVIHRQYLPCSGYVLSLPSQKALNFNFKFGFKKI